MRESMRVYLYGELPNAKDYPMFIRKNTTTEADLVAAHEYIHSGEPVLTTSDDAGCDDLYSRRTLRAMLAELEANLPTTHHIVSINHDIHAYCESLAVVLLVPGADDPSVGMKSHAVANRIAQKAFDTVCGWHPDHGGLLLSTYGVLPDGTLTYDLKRQGDD